MLPLRLLYFGSCVALATSVSAGDVTLERDSGPATLIELYSSEGCSSCPPAEEWLGRLKDSSQLWRQVFPVAFHVDYWDGLGWPDRFARPAYTERQRDYAAKLHQDSVYTPEFVVNGSEWRGWFHGEATPAAQETQGRLVLTIKSGSSNLSAVYQPAAATAATSYMLHVCLLATGISSDVQAGENGGRQLHHDFIVLDFHSAALAAGQDGHYRSESIAYDTGSHSPQAVVGWVSTPETEMVQIVGGWLR